MDDDCSGRGACVCAVVNLVGWIARDVGCLDPVDANIDESVMVIGGANGECFYRLVNR